MILKALNVDSVIVSNDHPGLSHQWKNLISLAWDRPTLQYVSSTPDDSNV